MHTIKRIWINNYKDFRSTFDNDKEAEMLISYLKDEVLREINDDTHPRLNLVLAVAYDNEGGIALFDVESYKCLKDGSVIMNLTYTGTAK
jgi:hypothetical protein